MHHSSKPPKSSTHMSPKAKRTTTVSSSHAGVSATVFVAGSMREIALDAPPS